MAAAAVSSRQVTLSPGLASPGISNEIRSPPPVGGVKQQENGDRKRGENYGQTKDPEEDPVVVRIRPSVGRKVANHGTRPTLSQRSPLPKKTHEHGPLHVNKTRYVPGARRVWPNALRKKLVPQKYKLSPENRTLTLVVKYPEEEAVRPERSDITEPSGKSASQENSSESSWSSPKQEKKCMNKLKVTHIKLPHKDQRGSGLFTKDGAALVLRKTLPSSSDSGDASDSSAVSESDYSPDPFNKLLTDSLTNLNITTFYLGQSEPSDHSADSEAVEEQVFNGEKQPGYFPPAPQSPSTSPTPTVTVSILPELPQSHASIHQSSRDRSSSGESKEPRTNILQVSPEHKKQPTVQQSPGKSGFLHRTRPINGVTQNNVHQKSSPHNLHLQTQSSSSSTLQVKTPTPLPASDESLSNEETDQAGDVQEHNSVGTAGAQSEEEKKAAPIETSRITARRLPLRRGFVRRPVPNIGPLRNRTLQNGRILPGPFRRLKNASDGSDQQLTPSRLTDTSSPPEGFNLTRSPNTREEEHHGVRKNISSVLRQASLRGASPSHPSARVGFFRRPALNRGHLTNNTNNRLKQAPRQQGEFALNRSASRRPAGQAAPLVGHNPGHLEEDTAPPTQGNRLEKQMGPTATEVVQHRLADDTRVAQREGHGAHSSPHLDNLERVKPQSVQTGNLEEDLPKMRDLDAETDNHNQKVKDGKGSDDQTRPQARKPFSSSRQGSPKLVRPSARFPLTRHSLLNKYINKTPNRNNTNINNTNNSLLESKTEGTKEAASRPQTRSDSFHSGATREPLENVAVTNRTSKGFTLTWDSPEGKYEKFVVTRKEIGKDEDREQGVALRGEPKSVKGSVGVNLGNGLKESATGDQPFQKVLASSARSVHFAGLPPQTDYTVTLLGQGPGLLSRLHKLVISTGTNLSDRQLSNVCHCRHPES